MAIIVNVTQNNSITVIMVANWAGQFPCLLLDSENGTVGVVIFLAQHYRFKSLHSWNQHCVLLNWTLANTWTKFKGFTLQKMHTKMSSTKYRLFCSGLNALTPCIECVLVYIGTDGPKRDNIATWRGHNMEDFPDYWPFFSFQWQIPCLRLSVFKLAKFLHLFACRSLDLTIWWSNAYYLIF